MENLWDVIEEFNGQDCAFCLELLCNKNGIIGAQVVTADGCSKVKDNKYLVAISKLSLRKKYKLKDEIKDKYLIDYIADQINSTPLDRDIEIEENKSLQEQFESLYKSEWESGWNTIWESRQKFDKAWQEFAEDDFSNWEKSALRIKNLRCCMDEINERICGKTEADITSGKTSEPYLKEFYNIQCFKEGDARTGYFEDTLSLLRAIVDFDISQELNCPLCDIKTRFNRLSELAKCLGNRNKVILRSQWERLYDCYSKKISAKTFMNRIYPMAAVTGEIPSGLDPDCCFIQSFETLEKFNEHCRALHEKDFDYIIHKNKLDDYIIYKNKNYKNKNKKRKDHFIQRIQSSELQDDLASSLKYPDKFNSLKKLLEFDMGQVTQELSFLVNNTEPYPYPTTYQKWQLVKASCTNQTCHHQDCLAAQTTPIDKWSKNTKFCYNDEMQLVLTNLFYLTKHEQNESVLAKEDIEFNLSIIAKAIRVFCENVMLALCYVGEIPAARFTCKYNNSRGFFYRKQNVLDTLGKISFADPSDSRKTISFKDGNNQLKFNGYYNVSKGLVIKTAVDMNERPNWEAYSLNMKAIANDICSLLDFANPEMHGNGNAPSVDELEGHIEKIATISEKTYSILSSKTPKN